MFSELQENEWWEKSDHGARPSGPSPPARDLAPFNMQRRAVLTEGVSQAEEGMTVRGKMPGRELLSISIQSPPKTF